MGQTLQVGNRMSGYVSLDQGVGTTVLSVYAFNLLRSAGVEETPVGPAVLPRGNVFAGGALWSIPLASGTNLTPRLEIRDSRSEVEDSSSGLQRLGRTTRLGADVRQPVGQRAALVLRGDFLFGSVLDTTTGTDLDVTGYRAALQVEIR